MNKVESRILKIRELISNSKRPLMFFDTDTDGSCSFLQLREAFPHIKKGFPLSKDDESQARGAEEIEKKTDLVIFFDTPFVKKELIEKIGDRKVIWVDHHNDFGMREFCDSENFVGLNPLWFNENDNRCSSYWAYRIADKKENLFYVAMASVADFYLLDVLRELYEYDRSLFRVLFNITDEKRKEIFAFLDNYTFDDYSVNQKRAEYIHFLSYEGGLILFKYYFDLIFKFEKDEDFAIGALKNIEKLSPAEFKGELVEGKSKYFEKFSLVMDEYKKVYKELSKKAKGEYVYAFHEDTVISFNRQISEELMYRVKECKVVFSAYKKSGKPFVSCSFRGRNFDVNELIQESVNGLNGRGGGHMYAAGCIISSEDFDEFKRRVDEKLKDQN